MKKSRKTKEKKLPLKRIKRVLPKAFTNFRRKLPVLKRYAWTAVLIPILAISGCMMGRREATLRKLFNIDRFTKTKVEKLPKEDLENVEARKKIILDFLRQKESMSKRASGFRKFLFTNRKNSIVFLELENIPSGVHKELNKVINNVNFWKSNKRWGPETEYAEIFLDYLTKHNGKIVFVDNPKEMDYERFLEESKEKSRDIFLTMNLFKRYEKRAADLYLIHLLNKYKAYIFRLNNYKNVRDKPRVRTIEKVMEAEGRNKAIFLGTRPKSEHLEPLKSKGIEVKSFSEKRTSKSFTDLFAETLFSSPGYRGVDYGMLSPKTQKQLRQAFVSEFCLNDRDLSSFSEWIGVSNKTFFYRVLKKAISKDVTLKNIREILTTKLPADRYKFESTRIFINAVQTILGVDIFKPNHKKIVMQALKKKVPEEIKGNEHLLK